MDAPDVTEEPAWRKRLQEKIRTADEALEEVQSGEHLFIGSGAAEPQRLVEALVRRANTVFGAEIVHIMTLGLAPYTEPKWGDNFRHNALFIGPNVREAVAEGRADYTPIFLSEIPRLFETENAVMVIAEVNKQMPRTLGDCLS